ncbi:MAG: hypothetical protein CSA38_00915 [Flavobacteriales bacterium]|nr:MAG: hypothetical protein CSA38_00915 [Flavobacteriales bacterium]
MKKILFLGLALATLTACRKDDDKKDEPKEEQSLLIGTWKREKIAIVSGGSNTDLYAEVADECTGKSTLDFRVDNNVESHSYAWNQDNTECQDLGKDTTPYSYNEETKKMTITGDEGDQVVDVKTLTSTKLVLEFQMEDLDSDGVADYAQIEFKK